MPFGLGLGELMLVAVVVLLPAWRIVTKAGYPGVLALLVMIPLVNIIVFFAFAFSEWPLEKRARSNVSV